MEPTFELVRASVIPQDRLPNALDIAEQFVTATGLAIMERDFQSFAERFALPLSVTTLAGDRIIRSSDELLSSFEKVIDHYRLLGVERMVRTCLRAERTDESTINCVHETRLYGQTGPVQQPFQVRSTLRCIRPKWRITSADYAIEDSLGYTRALTE